MLVGNVKRWFKTNFGVQLRLYYLVEAPDDVTIAALRRRESEQQESEDGREGRRTDPEVGAVGNTGKSTEENDAFELYCTECHASVTEFRFFWEGWAKVWLYSSLEPTGSHVDVEGVSMEQGYRCMQCNSNLDTPDNVLFEDDFELSLASEGPVCVCRDCGHEFSEISMRAGLTCEATISLTEAECQVVKNSEYVKLELSDIVCPHCDESDSLELVRELVYTMTGGRFGDYDNDGFFVSV